MKHVRAPETWEWDHDRVREILRARTGHSPDPRELVCPFERLFLAGGITGCPDWQSEVVESLSDWEGLIILNPRQKKYIETPEAAEAQISWEFDAFKKASIVLFWFPKDQIQPIALFEYGKHLAGWGQTKVYVGRDDGYPRALDIDIQTKLARPNLYVHRSLPAMLQAIRQNHDFQK